MKVPFNLRRVLAPADLPTLFSNLERELETVINVLQPGPLGIVEHKFSDSELDNAKATVARAVASWRKAASSSR